MNVAKPKKSSSLKHRETSDKAIPAWLFFLLLAVLGTAAVYYKNSAGRMASHQAPAQPAPLSPALPSTAEAAAIAGNQEGVLGGSPGGGIAHQLASRNVSQGPFENLPGFPLTELNMPQRKKFLARVNSEYCNCGCKGDTIARCLVKDPACRIAPAMATRVLAEIRTSGQ